MLPISTTNLIAQLKQETEDTDDTKYREGAHSSQLAAQLKICMLYYNAEIQVEICQ